ncbi:MAG TPA: hypothetical protein VNO24_07740 [Blastocatellia bacterium]|nr:hypothetical protein [Blastocatellia bacterium]
MNEQARGWIEILTDNDAAALWDKLFKLVSRHSSIRTLFNSDRIARARLQDLNADVTQDLFLKLHRKDRWRHYVDAGYSNANIEHELYHIEVPNLVSLLLRERQPEAYRMARRISNLVQTSAEFRRYRRTLGANHSEGKLSTRVFGLREWPDDKPTRAHQNMEDLLKDVAYRGRDRRRAGRGGSSHIIISNRDLTDLLVEIFRAVDSPLDVRIVRSLALSKLPVEDSRFVSIDAAVTPDAVSDPEPLKVDFPDQRPTPEQRLLENETNQQAEAIAVELLDKMREVVRHKPRRYSRLARVAWYCYFDLSSPSQTTIARRIGISNSLVTHYRQLFDAVIRDVELGAGQYIPFLHAFSRTLEMSISETAGSRDNIRREPETTASPRYPLARAAVATQFT